MGKEKLFVVSEHLQIKKWFVMIGVQKFSGAKTAFLQHFLTSVAQNYNKVESIQLSTKAEPCKLHRGSILHIAEVLH